MPTSAMETDLPAFYGPLSLKINRVLEAAGVSLDNRKEQMEKCNFVEIINTIIKRESFESCFFGSAYEGTALGLDSDCDQVSIDRNLEVVTDISNTCDKEGLLLVQDNDTPAGYAKLQFVGNGVPLNIYNSPLQGVRGMTGVSILAEFCADKYDRLVFAHKRFDYKDMKCLIDEKHGPAYTRHRRGDVTAMDFVSAFRCRSVPACASEWFSRNRRYNIPTPSQIDACKVLGCLFVAIGHPFSAEQNLEWRISFSHQERRLITSFNAVQLRCYVLLKMIKKNVISLFLKREVLTSYHCKTCILYLIENTPPSFWSPSNLLACLSSCLKLITLWSEQGVCPNYFIPSENMFQKPSRFMIVGALCSILKRLVDAEFGWLLYLDTFDFGARLHQALKLSTVSSPAEFAPMNNKLKCLFLRQANVAYLIASKNFVLTRCYSDDMDDVDDTDRLVTSIFDELSEMRETEAVEGHSKEDTRNCISVLQPYIEISLMSNIVALAVKDAKEKTEIQRLMISDKWNQLGHETDPFTAKLKQACHLCVRGYNVESLTILTTLEQQVGFPVCGCDGLDMLIHLPVTEELDNALQRTDINDLGSLLIPCVVFLPTELEIIPSALGYEMMRSDIPVAIYPWYSWAVVDGKFLLHFLKFFNHSMMKKVSEMNNDFENMATVVTKFKLGHEETAFNLLGWAYKDQGWTDMAKRCFRQSLQIKPAHNAAHLHLKDMGE